MKNHLLPPTLLTICCIVFFSGVYTVAVWSVAYFSPNHGNGEVVSYRKDNSSGYGYTNVGQSFTEDNYFWSRPSAVKYNGAGSAGSNKGPSNPDYLTQVQARIDTFLVHNPDIEKTRIPADLITASGSGLDPHISLQAAVVQIPRIARRRGIPEKKVAALVADFTEQPLFEWLGPVRVNVLKMNIALDGVTK